MCTNNYCCEIGHVKWKIQPQSKTFMLFKIICFPAHQTYYYHYSSPFYYILEIHQNTIEIWEYVSYTSDTILYSAWGKWYNLYVREQKTKNRKCVVNKLNKLDTIKRHCTACSLSYITGCSITRPRSIIFFLISLYLGAQCCSALFSNQMLLDQIFKVSKIFSISALFCILQTQIQKFIALREKFKKLLFINGATCTAFIHLLMLGE